MKGHVFGFKKYSTNFSSRQKKRLRISNHHHGAKSSTQRTPSTLRGKHLPIILKNRPISTSQTRLGMAYLLTFVAVWRTRLEICLQAGFANTIPKPTINSSWTPRPTLHARSGTTPTMTSNSRALSRHQSGVVLKKCIKYQAKTISKPNLHAMMIIVIRLPSSPQFRVKRSSTTWAGRWRRRNRSNP